MAPGGATCVPGAVYGPGGLECRGVSGYSGFRGFRL